MLFGRKNKLGDSYETPIFGTTESGSSIPKEELGKDSIAPNVAYRLIKDELMNEGNARLNLCTFCQTYMEDEATKLMACARRYELHRNINSWIIRSMYARWYGNEV